MTSQSSFSRFLSIVKPAALFAAGFGAKNTRSEGLSHQYDEEPFDFSTAGTAGQLKAPGHLESWNGDAQRVVHPHIFGGLKLDITKPMGRSPLRAARRMGVQPEPDRGLLFYGSSFQRPWCHDGDCGSEW